jgi:glycosyltransferase involved in cell wall biosynthesis
MKVCMAATSFPRWPGDGQGAFVWGLAQALQRKGVTVQVVALHTPGAKTQEVINGVQVWRPPYWWPEQAEILRKDGGGLPITLRKYPLARLQLAPFLLRHSLALAHCARNADVVHAHWTLSGGAALWACWRYQRPLVVTVQGSDIFQVPQHPVGAWLTRTLLGRVQRITALSEALKRATCRVGIAEQQVTVIPNGVDVRLFTPPAYTQREPVILFVGYLIVRKGVRYLLEALPTVLQRLPNARIVLIGDGPEEVALRQQARDLGIAERVEFLGFLSQGQVRQWMQRASVFVLPSLEEGQGVVLLEALASGLPVVASQVDGIQEVVTPSVGILVKPASAPSLAQAILTLLQDQTRWEGMSQQARHHMLAHYDWEEIALRYLELYQTLG